jgi:hypothetical protein
LSSIVLPARLFDLLLACLEYRFGAETGLSVVPGPPGAPDDIALSRRADHGDSLSWVVPGE